MSFWVQTDMSFTCSPAVENCNKPLCTGWRQEYDLKPSPKRMMFQRRHHKEWQSFLLGMLSFLSKGHFLFDTYTFPASMGAGDYFAKT